MTDWVQCECCFLIVHRSTVRQETFRFNSGDLVITCCSVCLMLDHKYKVEWKKDGF